LRHVLPLPGVVLYVRRADAWHRFGELLPCDGPPEAGDVLRLDHVIFPAPLQVILPPPRELRPVMLRLIRDGQVRPATAMRCPLSALTQWADGATSDQIGAVQAALCRGAGFQPADAARQAGSLPHVLLLGNKLPPLPESERFWGRRVLTPLGFRALPALPESALGEVLGLQAEEIAVLDQLGVEVLSEKIFEPLTRASVRLAAAERTQ
jgi:hypothetical protein